MNSNERIAFLEAEVVKYKAQYCGLVEMHLIGRGVPMRQAEEMAKKMLYQAANETEQLETYTVTDAMTDTIQ